MKKISRVATASSATGGAPAGHDAGNYNEEVAHLREVIAEHYRYGNCEKLTAGLRGCVTDRGALRPGKAPLFRAFQSMSHALSLSNPEHPMHQCIELKRVLAEVLEQLVRRGRPTDEDVAKLTSLLDVSTSQKIAELLRYEIRGEPQAASVSGTARRRGDAFEGLLSARVVAGLTSHDVIEALVRRVEGVILSDSTPQTAAEWQEIRTAFARLVEAPPAYPQMQADGFTFDLEDARRLNQGQTVARPTTAAETVEALGSLSQAAAQCYRAVFVAFSAPGELTEASVVDKLVTPMARLAQEAAKVRGANGAWVHPAVLAPYVAYAAADTALRATGRAGTLNLVDAVRGACGLAGKRLGADVAQWQTQNPFQAHVLARTSQLLAWSSQNFGTQPTFGEGGTAERAHRGDWVRRMLVLPFRAQPRREARFAAEAGASKAKDIRGLQQILDESQHVLHLDGPRQADRRAAVHRLPQDAQRLVLMVLAVLPRDLGKVTVPAHAGSAARTLQVTVDFPAALLPLLPANWNEVVHEGEGGAGGARTS